MVNVEITNVIGWISYQQEFDLAALAEAFSQRDEVTKTTYEPSKNHWLQTHFAPYDTYVAFYRSGRCSITGVKSIKEFQEVVCRVNIVMRDLIGFEYEPEHKVANIVAMTELDLTVSLEVLALELGMDSVEYEPEQFPGLIYRESDYVILIFNSGKMICTGLANLDDITDVVQHMKQRTEAIT